MKMMRLMRFVNPCTSVIGPTDGKFIFHSSYYRTCSHPDALNVTTVHDFVYRLFEKNPLKRFVICSQQSRAIRRADAVVCISESTKGDLFRFFPDVDPSKVSVIYNGVDRRFHRIENSVAGDYVLFVGKRDKYKNFNSLVSPLAELGRRLKIVGVPLTDKEKRLMTDAGLDYEYCGMVSDEELNRLYNSAFCLLYTSSYEGFGLPVLEAQMAGCPVIACNSSSIPEVIGDGRMLINAVSVHELQEKFAMLNDENVRKDIIDKGVANAGRFSWETMAEQYYALYQKLLK